jgi:hypothetical protein
VSYRSVFIGQGKFNLPPIDNILNCTAKGGNWRTA